LFREIDGCADFGLELLDSGVPDGRNQRCRKEGGDLDFFGGDECFGGSDGGADRGFRQRCLCCRRPDLPGPLCKPTGKILGHAADAIGGLNLCLEPFGKELVVGSGVGISLGSRGGSAGGGRRNIAGEVSQGNFVDLGPVGADQLVGLRRRRPQNHRG
jgi:hypothetical protein